MFPKLDIWHSLSTYTDCPTAASAFNDLPFRNKEKQFFKLSALPLKDLFGFVFMLWIFFLCCGCFFNEYMTSLLNFSKFAWSSALNTE